MLNGEGAEMVLLKSCIASAADLCSKVADSPVSGYKIEIDNPSPFILIVGPTFLSVIPNFI